METVQDLLKKSPFLIFDFDHLHMTALHWASKKGHYRLAEFLIQVDSDIDGEDIVGRTPLYLALDSGHHDLAEMLIYNLASPWSTSKISYSPLYNRCKETKRILSTRRKLDILLMMTPPKLRA